MADEEEDLREIGMIYGSAVPMMLRHERQLLAEPERMPGLRSSFLCTSSITKPSSAAWDA